MDERTFFPEASGSSRSYHDSYQQQLNSFKSSSYASSQFHNINDDNSRQQCSSSISTFRQKQSSA
ncbi:hypothetical protein RYX36_019401 [Vicia faba]